MKSLFSAKKGNQKSGKTPVRATTKASQASKMIVSDVKTPPKTKTKKRDFNLKPAQQWVSVHWRGLISGLIISALAILTMSLGVNSLLPGQNKFETETLNNIHSIKAPWQNAVNIAYNAPAHFIGNILDSPLEGARITSVIYGLLCVALMFYIIKRWFNVRIATVGSLLFMTSSWLLHISHMAAPLILLVFGPLAILASFSWFHRTKKFKFLSFVILLACLAFCAYIAYMPWMVAVVAFILFTKEKRIIAKLSKKQIATAVSIMSVLLVPLFVSLIQNPSQYHILLGIPASLPSFKIYFVQLAYTLSMVVFRSASLPELHLANLPMLDIFSAAMLFLGVYYLAQRIKSRHSMIIFASTIAFILLIPLSNFYQLSAKVLMPFVYVFVIAGIVELLNQWFTYFPRNPWVRNFGVVMIVIAIGFASFYHLQRYYVAWPNSTETKNSYTFVATKQ